MTTIYKYPVKILHKQTLCFRGGQELLHLDYQKDELFAWIRTHTTDSVEMRLVVELFGTGHELSPEGEYFKTLVDDFRGLVWHVYISSSFRKL